MDQRGTPAIDRAGAAEAALPAGGSGRGDSFPWLRRGDGDRANDHGGWWVDAVDTLRWIVTQGDQECSMDSPPPKSKPAARASTCATAARARRCCCCTAIR